MKINPLSALWYRGFLNNKDTTSTRTLHILLRNEELETETPHFRSLHKTIEAFFLYLWNEELDCETLQLFGRPIELRLASLFLCNDF